MDILPTIFVSHGAPTLLLEDSPTRRRYDTLSKEIARPTAVLCVSAHWETRAPRVSAATNPETIHDFWGFPPELYQIQYAAPGAPALAQRTVALLTDAGIPAETHPRRGLDHGAWVPLVRMYPKADIPVAQLSLQTHLGPSHHLAMGRALAPLREEGVLILCSGGATHNLADIQPNVTDAPPAYVREFGQWLDTQVTTGDTQAVLEYRSRIASGQRAHPREEHLLPLLVAMGAAKGPGRILSSEYRDGCLYLANYSFS